MFHGWKKEARLETDGAHAREEGRRRQIGEEERESRPKERRTISVIPPDAKNQKIVSEIKKMNVLTPYSVATRYNIRISAAKDFLEQLEQNGAVQLVSGNHEIKIYKPTAAAAAE
jgi:ribosomal protein S25